MIASAPINIYSHDPKIRRRDFGGVVGSAVFVPGKSFCESDQVPGPSVGLSCRTPPPRYVADILHLFGCGGYYPDFLRSVDGLRFLLHPLTLVDVVKLALRLAGACGADLERLFQEPGIQPLLKAAAVAREKNDHNSEARIIASLGEIIPDMNAVRGLVDAFCAAGGGNAGTIRYMLAQRIIENARQAMQSFHITEHTASDLRRIEKDIAPNAQPEPFDRDSAFGRRMELVEYLNAQREGICSAPCSHEQS